MALARYSLLANGSGIHLQGRDSANAFLALIGPSMGGATRGETVERGGANRPFRDSMEIGRDVTSFDWGDQRKTRWTRLCSDMLGGESYVSALTALLNLDWRHSTSEAAIPSEHLADGFTRYVWPLLCELRPRLVCVLTNRVWDTVGPEIERGRVQFASCPVSLARVPIVFRFPDCDFPTMLVKPHYHPSRALSYDQIAELGRACQWFLNQVA